MNPKLFFIILLFLGGVIVFGLTARPSSPVPPSTNSPVTPSLQTQSKTMGVVTVEITPISVSPGKDLKFELDLNNHSVDLSYDYTKIATLTDDRENSYQPPQWTGNSSGHHVKGELIFPALPGIPKQLTLTLNGVDNKSAIFVWPLP